VYFIYLVHIYIKVYIYMSLLMYLCVYIHIHTLLTGERNLFFSTLYVETYTFLPVLYPVQCKL